jgi:antibiotic biosynthesis monooxygenase (ABM) superfamily enzyme
VTGASKDQDLIDELAAWMQAPDAETAQTNGHVHAKVEASALSGPTRWSSRSVAPQTTPRSSLTSSIEVTYTLITVGTLQSPTWRS